MIEKIVCHKCKLSSEFWEASRCPVCKIGVISKHQSKKEEIVRKSEKQKKYKLVIEDGEEKAIDIERKYQHAKINQIRGDYIEYLATKFFESKGYTVIKLVFKIGSIDVRYILNKNDVEYFCKAYEQRRLLKYLMRCSEEIEVGKTKGLAGLPDILCLKDGEVFFVECKSNDSDYNENQLKKFEELQKKGYIIKEFRTKINLTDITLKE